MRADWLGGLADDLTEVPGRPRPGSASPSPAEPDGFYFSEADALTGDGEAGVSEPARVPVLPALLVVLALLPAEISLNITGLNLSAPRLALLFVFPLLAMRLLQGAVRPGFHPSFSDFVIVPLSIWMFLSVSVSEGVWRALIGSSVMILEFVGGYLTTRLLPLRPGPAVAFGRFTAGALAVAALFGPLDTLTGRHVTHEIADLLTHYNLPWGTDMRGGLLRANGTLDHPILLGCCCCFGAVLSVTLLRGVRRLITVACCLAGLFSAISSAPIMATLLAFGFIAYRKLTPNLQRRWLLLGTPMATFIALLLGASSNPFGFIFQHFTMDPETGFYRLLIWQVAGALVMGSPWFGIGLDDWARESWMPSTVDSVWLRSAMTFGIVGSVMIALVLLGSCSRAMRPKGRVNLSADHQDLGLALGIIIFLYAYLGFTVHFWGCTWILMGVFAGLRANLGALAADQPLDEWDDDPV